MENNNRRKLGTYQICLIALAIVMNVIGGDRKSTRLNSSHTLASRMPSSA